MNRVTVKVNFFFLPPMSSEEILELARVGSWCSSPHIIIIKEKQLWGGLGTVQHADKDCPQSSPIACQLTKSPQNSKKSKICPQIDIDIAIISLTVGGVGKEEREKYCL